jgi:hypothetical protein
MSTTINPATSVEDPLQTDITVLSDVLKDTQYLITLSILSLCADPVIQWDWSTHTIIGNSSLSKESANSVLNFAIGGSLSR